MEELIAQGRIIYPIWLMTVGIVFILILVFYVKNKQNREESENGRE
jgi:hypothetical protein